MDEPFGALDTITRESMQDDLLALWRRTGKTFLFVTHDIDEATYLADQVIVLGGAPAMSQDGGLRKGRAAMFNLTRDMRGEARSVERAFGLGLCV